MSAVFFIHLEQVYKQTRGSQEPIINRQVFTLTFNL